MSWLELEVDRIEALSAAVRRAVDNGLDAQEENRQLRWLLYRLLHSGTWTDCALEFEQDYGKELESEVLALFNGVANDEGVTQEAKAPVPPLPDWVEISGLIDRGEQPNPLEAFIYEQEPAGSDSSATFRETLQAALVWYSGQVYALQGHLDALQRVADEQTKLIPDLLMRAHGLEGVLQRIAGLAEIGQQFPTAANFKNIRQHVLRALGNKESD